jgi:hypothetical protein
MADVDADGSKPFLTGSLTAEAWPAWGANFMIFGKFSQKKIGEKSAIFTQLIAINTEICIIIRLFKKNANISAENSDYNIDPETFWQIIIS